MSVCCLSLFIASNIPVRQCYSQVMGWWGREGRGKKGSLTGEASHQAVGSQPLPIMTIARGRLGGGEGILDELLSRWREGIGEADVELGDEVASPAAVLRVGQAVAGEPGIDSVEIMVGGSPCKDPPLSLEKDSSP